MKTRCVVFLDFDGVLNYNDWVVSIFQTKTSYLLREEYELVPELVQKVSNFVQQVDGNVVISSTWRYDNSLETLNEYLCNRGWTAPPAIDITPRVSNQFRGDEIDLWLADHPTVSNYVILDDGSDMTEDQKKYHFVQTDWDIGITDIHLENAKTILLTQFK